MTLVETLAGLGVELLDYEKTWITSAEAKVNPEVVQGLVNLINSSMTGGGIAGLVEGSIKSQLIAAEPHLEATLQADEEALMETLEGALTRISQGK
jgi:hypothetical protein